MTAKRSTATATHGQHNDGRLGDIKGQHNDGRHDDGDGRHDDSN